MEDPTTLACILGYHYETLSDPVKNQIGTLCNVSRTWSDIITALWGDQELVWHVAITTAAYHGDLCCLKFHLQRMPKHFIKNYDQYLIYALVLPSIPCLEYLWESYLAYPKKNITETVRTALRQSDNLCNFLIDKKIKFDADVVAPELLYYRYSHRSQNRKTTIPGWTMKLLKSGKLGNLLDIYESAIRSHNISLIEYMDKKGLAADWTWERNPDLVYVMRDAKRLGKDIDVVPRNHPPSEWILDRLWEDLSTRVIAMWLMDYERLQPPAKKIKIDL